MRFIFSIVKNIIAVLAIIAIIYIALKYALSLEIKNGILYMKVLIIFNKICMIPANNRLPAQPKTAKVIH